MKFVAGKPESGGGEFYVPAGEYRLRVIDAIERASQNTGNPYLKLTLRVLNPDGTEGPKVFDNLVFVQNAQWKIDQFLKSAGMHPGEGVEFDIQVGDTIGWEVTAKLKVEEYQGNKNNKVDSYIFEDSDDFSS